jgi:imidazoleglycerol phosphate synthase glutamine amidotransferase subunit HisH
MERLRASGWSTALRERVAAGRPTLGICLGLQLLASAARRAPGVAGLGVLPGIVRRFPATVRVPQLGWNEVEPAGRVPLLARLRLLRQQLPPRPRPRGLGRARTDHGGPFVAALERGAVLACQFHPELSGAWGRPCSCAAG